MAELENIKHELYCRNLILYNGNETLAYKATYDNEHIMSNEVAQAAGSRLLSDVIVETRLRELLNEYGARHNEAAVKELYNQIYSNKRIIQRGKAYDVPDNAARLQAIDKILSVHGIGKTDAPAVSINVMPGPEDMARLEKIITAMRELKAQAVHNKDAIDADAIL